jgi:arylsulfatase A-like enzyme
VVAGAPDGRPDVILYEIDTMRADLLEPLGFPGRSSPRMGALARGGAVFSECTSSASWTRPAAVSIMTSLSAATHGVIEERVSLPAEVVTMTDILRDAGWYTVAFQSNPNAGRAAGLDQGFDLVVETNALLEHVTANMDRWSGRQMFSTGTSSGTSEMIAFLLADLLPDWAGLPLFLYVHPNDPHAPYDPRPPFSSIPGFGRDGAPLRVNKPLSAYSRDVRSADWFLGRVLDRLEEDGRLEGAVIALLADHGEEFQDHGRAGHGVNLHPETLRVPLILSAPGRVPAGKVRRDRVTVADVLPTLLDLLDLEPPPGAEGRSLLPLLDDPSGGERFPDEPVFAHVVTMKLRMDHDVCDDPEVLGTIAVLAGPWKCIVSDYGSHREPSVLLYDLRTDPGELSDVAEGHPGLAAALEAQAREWWAAGPRIATSAGEVGGIDPEFVDELRALGYIE